MIGFQELVVILIIILLLFGPKKLPELAESLAKAYKKFKDNLEDKNDNKKKKSKGIKRKKFAG